jgi:Xaa-Pro aminopeptidase
MKTIVQEKTIQAVSILNELDIDLWLTLVRETATGGDPILPIIYGHDLTWQSAILIFRNGVKIAIVGHFETETALQVNAFDNVISYHQSIKPALLSALEKYDPATIAINYSKNDVLADGLTFGMYQILNDLLLDTPWEERLVPAERIISALKGRKTETEITHIKHAIEVTEEIFNRTFNYVQLGMTERQIAEFMQSEINARGLLPAWEAAHCPTINAGPESPVGHVSPGNIPVKKGNILHIDFGVKRNEYCSDIQRVAYVMGEGDSVIPGPVRRGFDTVVQAIEECVAFMKPGIPGYEVDRIARESILKAGYPEFKYATGHQLGRLAHDGAGILGPKWDRYGDTPNYLLESGQVFTVEPGVMIPGYGYIGIEEDVLVTEGGTKFLTKPQKEIILI